MPTFFVNTDDARISNAFLATLGAAPGSTYLAQIKAFGLVNSVNAMIAATGKTTAADLATTITGNLGLTGAAATAGQAYLTSVTLAGASSTWAANLISTLDLFTTLQNDATYGTAASAYVARINSAVAYSAVAANNSTDLTTLAAAVGSAGSTGAGSTFTLTTGVDTITGSSGDDTIVADNTGTDKRLTVADTVGGGAGTDTLRIFLAAGDTATGQPTLTGIEKVYINGGAVTAYTAATGTTELSIDQQVVATQQTVTLSGQDLVLARHTLTASGAATKTTTIAAASTSTHTAQKVTVNTITNTGTDVHALDFSGTKVTTLNLVTTGAASKFGITNTGAAVTTINISGDKNLTTNANLGTLTKIDASTATGNISFDTSAGTAASTLAFIGGSGNDTLTMAAAATVSTQTLDGGGGTADILAIKDTAISSSTTTLNAGINAAKNFEILGLAAGASIAVDVSRISSVSQFDVTAAITGTAGAANTAATNAAPNNTAGTIGASFTAQTLAKTFIVDANITGGAGGANTVAYTGNVVGGAGAAGLKVAPTIDNASNAVTVTLSGVTITGGAGGNSANATGTDTGGAAGSAVDLATFETINIVSNKNADGTASTNTFTAGAAGTGADGNGAAGHGILVGANATINISGAANMTMGSIYSGTGSTPNNNVTINAGDLTGNLSATLGTGNDSVTGGSGTNTLSMGGGIDTINLSKSTAKADVITFNAVGTVDAKAAQFINITGFTNSGTAAVGDKIVFGNAGSLIGAVAANTINTGTTTALTTTISSGSIATFSAAGSAVTLNTRIDGVFTAMNSAGNKVAAFEFDGNTYLVQDNGTAGAYNSATDLVIQLVGLTGVTSVSTTASGAAAIFIA